MKIVSLEASNILRLTAAAVTVGDTTPIVTVSGQNGAGKSSLLNAIAMALGGKKLCLPEPLHAGKDKGHVSVDLGTYLVTRRFWRSAEHIGEVGSSLEVKSRDGAMFRSPQGLLDKLVSDFTFDPLAFLDLGPREQREHVRRMVGLDFTALDQRRSVSVARTTEAQTILKLAERDVDAGESYPNAPAEPVDVAQVVAALAEAERLADEAARAEGLVERKRRGYESTAQHITTTQAEVSRLTAELEAARERLVDLQATREREAAEGMSLRAAADSARAAVPDTAALRDRLAGAQAVNTQVQANQRHAAILQARDEARAALAEAKAATAAIDAEKQQALEGAAFPVAGLAFSDEGLTFQGLPFAQASYAQQLRVAVAMGLAANPELRVLFIRHGNALDKKSLALLADLAEEADAQVWLEIVREQPDGVSVFICDGRVVPNEVAV